MHDRIERAFIGVAGNIEPRQHLPEALEKLAKHVALLRLSRFFVTPAIGRAEQPDYYNAVVLIQTDIPPRTLKFDVFRGIERDLGRVRGPDKYAARTVDLDILLYGTRVVAESGLEIPDPDLCERAFLAAGVLELAPGIRMPGGDAPLCELVDANAIAGLRTDNVFSNEMQERFLT